MNSFKFVHFTLILHPCNIHTFNYDKICDNLHLKYVCMEEIFPVILLEFSSGDFEIKMLSDLNKACYMYFFNC